MRRAGFGRGTLAIARMAPSSGRMTTAMADFAPNSSRVSARIRSVRSWMTPSSVSRTCSPGTGSSSTIVSSRRPKGSRASTREPGVPVSASSSEASSPAAPVRSSLVSPTICAATDPRGSTRSYVSEKWMPGMSRSATSAALSGAIARARRAYPPLPSSLSARTSWSTPSSGASRAAVPRASGTRAGVPVTSTASWSRARSWPSRVTIAPRGARASVALCCCPTARSDSSPPRTTPR